MSPEGIDVKNRFSILDRINEDSNIVKYRDDGGNDIGLGDLQVRDLGIELLSIRKFNTKKKVLIPYPRPAIDFNRY